MSYSRRRKNERFATVQAFATALEQASQPGQSQPPAPTVTAPSSPLPPTVLATPLYPPVAQPMMPPNVWSPLGQTSQPAQHQPSQSLPVTSPPSQPFLSGGIITPYNLAASQRTPNYPFQNVRRATNKPLFSPSSDSSGSRRIDSCGWWKCLVCIIASLFPSHRNHTLHLPRAFKFSACSSVVTGWEAHCLRLWQGSAGVDSIITKVAPQCAQHAQRQAKAKLCWHSYYR